MSVEKQVLMDVPNPNERPKDVGILAIEVYVPSLYVRQQDLEDFDGIPRGKYTLGLGQEAMAFTGDCEDINSISLTCVSQLLEKYQIDPKKIGRLEIGTETIIDKSKSTKTVLMTLFEPHGNHNIEGVTTINACYGGTAALFNALAWVESSAWDGRYAIVVAADIAVYEKGPARPTSGCGAVAMLIGPNAPLVVDSRTRTTHANHIWDFYKPDPHHEFPTVDGHHSQACYLRALDDCYQRFAQKNTSTNKAFDLSSIDHAIFHSPYNKLVQKSYARLFFLDFLRCQQPIREEMESLKKWTSIPLEKTYTDRELDLITRKLASESYKQKVDPFTSASKVVGNCYTASVYLNLATLVNEKGPQLKGTKTLVFSYGSGSMASMFAIHATAGSHCKFTLAKIQQSLQLNERLAVRVQMSAEEFNYHMELREIFHGKKSIRPRQSIDLLYPGTYYLTEINEKFQRSYIRKPSTTTTTINTTDAVNKSLYGQGNSVLVAGISAGLPGGKSFGTLEVERLVSGENCIEKLSVELKDKLLAKRIVIKRRNPDKITYTSTPVTKDSESIQVAAQMGPIDLIKEYSLPKHLVESMDEPTRLAVAVGLEALLNAGLVEKNKENWILGPEYRDTTGIIYATSYPTMASTTSEVIRFYETPSSEYEFDRKLLFRVLVLANSQLAQITGAKGPNTQINAACAGTTQAISFAQDWLQLGKCERVLVIASDTASSEDLLPWIGGGFRALGAASIAPSVKEAALPFDARRNGMIVGAGAIGIVLESTKSFTKRSKQVSLDNDTQRRVKLLASYCSNSAYHGASLEVNHVAQEFEKFFKSLDREYGISKQDFVQNGVYYSHETFTNASATTSCAFVEIEALGRVLGSELIQKLMITNTKGFTGHPMGVSFEDVAAIQGLKMGKIPPVANFKQHDPNLNQGQPLRLSPGGVYEHCFALRFAAGFGSQLAFSFYSALE